jgi:hypothetical protein
MQAMTTTAVYHTLDPVKIKGTLEKLERRIGERFPGTGLWRVCGDLVGVANHTAQRVTEVAKPHWGLRLLLALVAIAALSLIVLLIEAATTLKGSDQLSDVMQGIDAAVNLAIVLGGAAFFVFTLENRWKRQRALRALYELRSLVHVIDMHQLTKDPSTLGGSRVSSSPDRNMTPFELMRYLDYCSEMLSLTGKLAALYSERLSDSVVVDTVGDIERLTSNLSNKIWLKISMVQQLEGRDMPLPMAAPMGTVSSMT